MNRAFSTIIIILIFALAGVLFFHNLTSVNADIGRHIKLGEIIWQTKSVPDTNLFSFTVPDHSFINHHWLSEVIFYGTYSLGSDWLSGLRTVMALKIIVLLAAYLLLFLIVKKRNIFSVVFAFLVSIFVFSARTEPRPEIFSYLIFALYLYVLFRAKHEESHKAQIAQNTNKTQNTDSEKHKQENPYVYLWLLPILQVFWVNLHIYFIIGPALFFFFLIDRLIEKKTNSKLESLNSKQIQNPKLKIKKLFGFFTLIILANLVNPNFIKGAIYPFTVLNNYGYSVAENSSLFFLAKYFGQWAPQDKLFLWSLIILAGSFILRFLQKGETVDKRLAKSFIHRVGAMVFDLLLVIMTVVLSFKMQRNIPLFALAVWPIMAKNMDDFRILNLEKLKKWLYACAIFILMASTYLVISGRFYRFLDSSKTFGLGVSSAAQDGTDFVKENNIQGPVFNNFDIGSYLVWQIKGSGPFFATKKGPDPFRVFVDGRPEAYPVEFFEDIYKPMQRDENIWEEKSKKYGINYIFFAHTDMTEWADEFLIRISKDKAWPTVFLNDAVVIFLKDTDINRSLVSKYKITEDNMDEKISQVLDKLDKNDINAFVNFGNVLYRFRYLASSAKIFEKLIKNQPANPHGYQGAGYAYAAMNDPATQEKAAKNLKKAINLGFKTFNNYFTLGIISANLGNYFVAEENIVKALKIKPDNRNARQTLETIRKQLLIVN